jgi:PIN domain nuclease of toxin-antitoxin system
MFILDSNILIDLLIAPRTIKPTIVDRLKSHDSNLFLSIASVWEIEIKRGLGKLDLGHFDWRGQPFVDRLDMVPITIDDSIRAGQLPLHHRDPFDRMIIAQALNRNATVVTSDDVFKQYGVMVLEG